MSDGAVVPFQTPSVRPNDDPNEWWCKNHSRMATHLRKRDGVEHPCCDPTLGGVLLPCDCERLTAERAPEQPDIGAIENLIKALEGMQTQIQAMTELLCEQDKRIEKLERRKIIRGIGA